MPGFNRALRILCHQNAAMILWFFLLVLSSQNKVHSLFGGMRYTRKYDISPVFLWISIGTENEETEK